MDLDIVHPLESVWGKTDDTDNLFLTMKMLTMFGEKYLAFVGTDFYNCW